MLQIVSGKGGVGKSVVAAAIAERHARSGKRTLLISYDQIGQEHPVYGVVTGYEPKRVGTSLDVSTIDAHLALKEYVKRKMAFSFAYLPILENPAVIRLFDALPLFTELLSLGKLYDLIGDESPYEHIVFDAPATGHCRILLRVPEVACKTLIAGPIYENARKIRGMLEDPAQAELVVVTLPEETPLREARELVEFARDEAGVTCSALLINRCRQVRFSDRELADLGAWRARSAEADKLVALAQFDTELATNQAQQVTALHDLAVPQSNLPDLKPAMPQMIAQALADVLP